MKWNQQRAVMTSLIFSGMSLSGVLFLNFDSTNLDLSSLGSVDQKLRVQHAKELLGRGYNGSVAEQAEQIKDLRMTILEDVQIHLPKKYQHQALELTEAIISQAKANDMDPVFVMAVIKTESGFNPKARGSHGEIGLMQIKPDTAKWIAHEQHLKWNGPSTLLNPIRNVEIGVAYFSHLRGKSSGFATKYLAAYNMGLAKVERLYKNSQKPHEYSLRVMKNYKEIYKRMIASRTAPVADMGQAN